MHQVAGTAAPTKMKIIIINIQVEFLPSIKMQKNPSEQSRPVYPPSPDRSRSASVSTCLGQVSLNRLSSRTSIATVSAAHPGGDGFRLPVDLQCDL